MIRSLACVGIVLATASLHAAETQRIESGGARFVGAVGCKSSSCHGGAGEKRSQYITWLKRDFHTRGYAILNNARSARIAETLGIPAQTSSRCTICHSPFQAISPARLAPTVDPQESVSCESCHGAAESWLRGHTRPDWSYATRVGAGMRDLKSFYVRANTCVACHQNLDSDIASAGHPALVFELDSQSIAEPKHWQDEPGSGVRAWLTGQAVALREVSWRLATVPGSDAQTLAQWNGLAWLLGKVTASGGALPPIEALSPSPDRDIFARVQQQADTLARRAAQQNFGRDFAERVTRELAASDREFIETATTSRDVLYRRAQRLLLALERLHDAVHRTGADAPRPAELADLRNEVRSLAEFNTARFAERLSRFRVSLAGQ